VKALSEAIPSALCRTILQALRPATDLLPTHGRHPWNDRAFIPHNPQVVYCSLASSCAEGITMQCSKTPPFDYPSGS